MVHLSLTKPRPALDRRPPTDSELVEAASQGDQRAYAKLYARHVNLVRLVVAERAGSRLDVADVVQEAFARGFERLGNLRDPADFRPWLLQIARRAALDHRRRRRPTVSLDDDGVEPPRSPDDVQTECEGRAADQELLLAIDRLPSRQATALRLVRSRGGTDYDYLAELLGTTPSAARTVIYRARRRLRALLAERWDIDISGPGDREPDLDHTPGPRPDPDRTEQS